MPVISNGVRDLTFKGAREGHEDDDGTLAKALDFALRLTGLARRILLQLFFQPASIHQTLAILGIFDHGF